HQRHARGLPDGPAQQSTFVQVGMHYVGLEAGCRSQYGGGERRVEIQLMPRGAYHDPALPGHVDRAPDVYARHIVSGVVSAESDRVAAAVEVGDLFEDALVRGIVREE